MAIVFDPSDPPQTCLHCNCNCFFLICFTYCHMCFIFMVCRYHNEDREHVPPKRQLTFTRRCSVISQMVELRIYKVYENRMISKGLWPLTSPVCSCCDCYLWSSLKEIITLIARPLLYLWYWIMYIAENPYCCITVCPTNMQLSNSITFAIQTASKYTTHALTQLSEA
jgi:hypothetical protein